MRFYDCYYGMIDNNGKIILNSNNACWRGISRGSVFWRINNADKKNKDYIFIKSFIEKEISEESRLRLISLINKITDCKIVTINKEKFIKYKPIRYYASDLVLLNMIRMLWYENQSFNQDQFFEDIMKNHKGKDTLMFLMECVKKNVLTGDINSYGYGNHSCVYKDIIPKKAKKLKEYKGELMQEFMISKM